MWFFSLTRFYTVALDFTWICWIPKQKDAYKNTCQQAYLHATLDQRTSTDQSRKGPSSGTAPLLRILSVGPDKKQRMYFKEHLCMGQRLGPPIYLISVSASDEKLLVVDISL